MTLPTFTSTSTMLFVLAALLGSLQLSSAQSGNTCGVAICFAIDESGSIGSADFPKTTRFVRDVIRGVSEIATEAQFGASRFGTTAFPVAGLSSLTSDASAAIAAINNINYIESGATNMEAGIAECYRVENGVRSGILTRDVDPNIPRLLLLLTDGKPNVKNTASPSTCTGCTRYPFNSPNSQVCLPTDYRGQPFDTSACSSQLVQQRAAAARADGIQFVSVGVGGGVDAEFLGSLGEYYAVANFNALQSAVEDIVAAVCSDVSVMKQTVRNPTPVGGQVVFRVSVMNMGRFDVDAPITFTDTLPAGLTYNSSAGVTAVGNSPDATCNNPAGSQQVTCTISSTLPVGVSFTYLLQATATAAGNFTNAVTVTATPDNNLGNNRDTSDVDVFEREEQIPTPITAGDLTLTKTVSSPTTVLNDEFSYNITVTNTDTTAIAENTFVIDVLPPGLVIVALPAGCDATGQEVRCGPSTLNPGDSASYAIRVNPSAAGTFDNAAVVQAGPPNATVEQGPVTSTVVVQHTCTRYVVNRTTNAVQPFDCEAGYRFNGLNSDSTSPSLDTCCIPLVPNVAITKTVTPNDVLIGSNVSYTITITNTGDGAARQSVLNDTLPAGLVFLGTLPQGESAEDCSFPERTPCGEIDDEDCTQPPLTQLICGPSTLAPGATRTYTVAARATAVGAWTNTAVLTFRAPTTNNTQTTEPATTTVTVTRTCRNYNSDGSRFDCAAGTEFAPDNATSPAPDQATCCQIARTPQLRLNKTLISDSDGEVLIGSTVTYLVEVSNVGNAAATNVTLVDTLQDGLVFATPLPQGCTPAGQVLTCGPFNLAVNASRQFTILATATAQGSRRNFATVIVPDNATTTPPPEEVIVRVLRTCRNYNSNGSRFDCAAGTEFAPENATSTTPDQATCCQAAGRPDIRLNKTLVQGDDDDSEVLIGSTLTYLVEVSNVGNAAATGVTLVDTLQGGQTFADPLPQGCSVSNQVLRCSPFNLAAGASREFQIVTTATAPGRRRNTARVIVRDNVTITPPPEQVVVEIIRTCRNYNSDGTRFDCPAGTAYDSEQNDNRTPRISVCCSRGACCNPNGACTQVPRNQCRGRGTYTPAVTCRQATCSPQAPSLGACCSDEECEDGVLTSECTARGGRPFVNRTCTSNPGPRGTCSAPNIPTGACCSDGECEDGVAANVCRNRGGKVFIGRTCASRPGGPGTCAAAPGPVGSCCTRDDRCLDGVTRAACDGTWRANGRCSAATCPAAYGACCVGTDQCSVVTAEGCASVGGRFNRGERCGAGTCSGEVPGVCTPSWLPCFPCAGPTCTDTCCPGSTCQVAVTYKSQRYYACRPQATCKAAGQLCGDCKGGGVCCSGLTCRWNFGSSTGRCVDPASTVCGYAGADCASDVDCCAGTRCGADNRCRPAVCDYSCARSFFKGKGCHIRQKLECKSLAAAAASSA